MAQLVEFGQRVDIGLHLMGAELHLDRFASANAHGRRALELGRITGQGFLFPALLPALAATYEMLGRRPEGIALLDGGIEAARLSGNRQALSLGLMNRSAIANTAGDLETAIACGEESLTLTDGLHNTLATSFAAFALVRARLLSGEPGVALALFLQAAGGEELPRMPGAWRTGGYEVLAQCLLGLGRPVEAERAVERCAQLAGEQGLLLGIAQAERAAAALDPEHRADRALGAAELLEQISAPLQAAQARVLAARGLSRSDAVAQLERAAEAYAAAGAPRRREAVEQELRRLGRTVYRRSGTSGLEGLTARELEIARLVVDRQTNTQIAAALFLSKKTVETHLRNIFAKVGVSSRVELARAVERADRA